VGAEPGAPAGFGVAGNRKTALLKTPGSPSNAHFYVVPAHVRDRCGFFTIRGQQPVRRFGEGADLEPMRAGASARLNTTTQTGLGVVRKHRVLVTRHAQVAVATAYIRVRVTSAIATPAGHAPSHALQACLQYEVALMRA